MGKQFIDFNYVKEQADWLAIMDHYGLEVLGDGDERRCVCPFHDDTKPSFTFNIANGKCQCHAASCDNSVKNPLDFVSAMEDTDDLRGAAKQLAAICDIGLAAPRSGRNSKKAAGGKTKAADKARPKPKSAKASPASATKKKKAAKPDPATPKENKVLGFKLTLDAHHEYGAERGFPVEWSQRFEMGFCSKGTMENRWAIPYHNASGELVGYIGRWALDESELPEDEEKYKLPKGFYKNLELYNLFRIAGQTKHCVIVEGAFDTQRLHMLSIPAVGLIGTSISDAQLDLLVRSGFRQVIVMLDHGADEAERTVITRVSRVLTVRSVELPEDEDPFSVGDDFLKGLGIPAMQS